MDHDDDGMATGWEYHFEFDPFDGADRLVDRTMAMGTPIIVNSVGHKPKKSD